MIHVFGRISFLSVVEHPLIVRLASSNGFGDQKNDHWRIFIILLSASDPETLDDYLVRDRTLHHANGVLPFEALHCEARGVICYRC